MVKCLWREGTPTPWISSVVVVAVLAGACSSPPDPIGDPTVAASVEAGAEAGAAGSSSAAPDAARPVLSIGGDGQAAAGAEAGTGSDAPDGSSSTISPGAPSTGPSDTTSAGGPTSTAGTTSTTSAAAPPPGTSRVIGNGTAASCTSDAVVAAVAAGGQITFDCGPDPVTITMTATAKVVNANGPEIVIDGGGQVTLSGGGRHRILYQNTCDETQGWTTSHCQNQDHPRLTVRNLTMVDGNATGERTEGGGGGAIFVRGGRLQIENVTFVNNRCDPTGPDVGGAAVRALSQHDGQPVVVNNSTFRGGVCSNGGAISSIGVSWLITDTVMTGNSAIGNGANPAQSGTPGGGSGGAIYADGNEFTIEVRRTRIEDNHAIEGGGAVFFVSNNRTGRLSILDSTLRDNPSDGFETQGLPGIFFLGAGTPSTSGSTLT